MLVPAISCKKDAIGAEYRGQCAWGSGTCYFPVTVSPGDNPAPGACPKRMTRALEYYWFAQFVGIKS